MHAPLGIQQKQPTDEQVVPRDHGQQTAIVRSIIGMGHLQLILHP